MFSLNNVVGPQKKSYYLVKFLKSKMADRSEMARNAIQSKFLKSKMTESSHFVKNFRLLADYNLVSIYIYIQTAMLGTREYTLCCPLGRMHTILVCIDFQRI